MLQGAADLSFSAQHMWVKADEDAGTAFVGLSEHLTEDLGEIVSIDMPMVGDELEMDVFCIHLHLEGGAIHHVGSPLSGRVVVINRDVLDAPGLLHAATYVQWLYTMEYDEPEEFHMLMSSTQYAGILDHL